MTEAGVKNLIVSSTCATLPGKPDRMPITEETGQNPINPYGQSKLMMEKICRDFDHAHGIRFSGDRYFNACGCDPTTPRSEHLMPRPHGGAAGDIDALATCSDYPTPDGTCIAIHSCQ